MCGIVGYIGNKSQGNEIVIQGLEKLEYRGYDSCGMVSKINNEIIVTKAVGKVKELKDKVLKIDESTLSLGHTRWATHGKPTIENSHPHQSYGKRFTIVHNGVINNFQELKEDYLENITFNSQTDTEVISSMLEKFGEGRSDTLKIISEVFSLLDGSFACGVIDSENPNVLYAVKNKSPLLIGIGEEFNCISSDALAAIKYTSVFKEINDFEIVELSEKTCKIFDFKLNEINRDTKEIKIDASDADKGTYDHYMLKEIEEESIVIRTIIDKYVPNGKYNIDSEIVDELKAADKIYIIASGTSYNAGLIAKNYFAKYAKKSVEVITASEYEYQMNILEKNPVFIIFSQSGETADARAVLKALNDENHKTITITNTEGSTLSREATHTILLHAGREIAVASTKAYTSQVALVYILANAVGNTEVNVKHNLSMAASSLDSIRTKKDDIKKLADEFLKDAKHVIYLGKGNMNYLAQESALKMKEITYIICESYPAGELKHGPISLIEDGIPVIVMIQNEHENGHVRSNIQEVNARGAKVMTIVPEKINNKDSFVIDDIEEDLIVLPMAMVGHYLAYYECLNRGLDVDQPRNLAKSVTVE